MEVLRRVNGETEKCLEVHYTFFYSQQEKRLPRPTANKAWRYTESRYPGGGREVSLVREAGWGTGGRYWLGQSKGVKAKTEGHLKEGTWRVNSFSLPQYLFSSNTVKALFSPTKLYFL